MRHPKTTWHSLPFRISNWHSRSSTLFKLLVLRTPRLAPGAWAEIPSWVWYTSHVFQKAYWTDLHESTYQINHNVLFVCLFHSLSLQALAQCPGYSKQAHDKCLLNELINGQIKQWPRAKKFYLEDYKDFPLSNCSQHAKLTACWVQIWLSSNCDKDSNA